MEIPSGAKLTDSEQAVFKILKKGAVAVSLCVLKETGHKCVNGIHVYVLGAEQENFICEKFPRWKIVSRNTVTAFCVIEDLSLKKILSAIKVQIKEALEKEAE